MDIYLMSRIVNHQRALRSSAARQARLGKALELLSSAAVTATKPHYVRSSVMIEVTNTRCIEYRFAVLVNKDLCEQYGGTPGIRVPSALAYALDIPCMQIFGAPAYDGLALNAAKIIESIVMGHIFTDGNKRTAWALATFFCLSNGYLLDPEYPESGRDAIVSLINHEMTVEELADFINANLLER